MREGVPVGPGPRGSLDDRDGDRRSPCAPAAVDVHAALAAIVGDARVRRDASLAPYTTFRVGGRADWLAEARGETELVRLLAAAGDLGLPVTMLGGGSNVLVADEGVRGLVVRSWHGGVSEVAPGVVRASAGVTINGLVRWTIRRGLAGLEVWAGTPGTVGGAIHGNAHFRDELIGDVVTDVGLVRANGTDAPARIRRTPRDAMDFGYDRSRLQETGEVVVWAEFGVTRAPAKRLRAAARDSLHFRKRTQPLALPSAGCIFQNPDPARDPVPVDLPSTAGALIDGAGWKGQAIGGARVSETHANFIVTAPGATARDVRTLLDRVQTAVAERYGVTLKPEVVFLGQFGADAESA